LDGHGARQPGKGRGVNVERKKIQAQHVGGRRGKMSRARGKKKKTKGRGFPGHNELTGLTAEAPYAVKKKRGSHKRTLLQDVGRKHLFAVLTERSRLLTRTG